MAIFDNIQMALASVLSNKMRSLLTMLGIIIGIGAVIAIQTVGNSLTNSLSDSMSGMGANSITVQVTQKDSDTESSRRSGFDGFGGGVNVRMFGPSTPGDSDLMTDEMIAEFREAFPDTVQYVECSESVGNGTMTSQTDSSTTVTASISGLNQDARYTKEIEPVYGRYFTQADQDGQKMVAVVADQFVKDALRCSPADAIGQRIKLKLSSGSSGGMGIGMSGNSSSSGSTSKVVELYIVGVYHYEEDSISSMFGGSSDSITTNLYLPITTAKKINGAAPGYQSFSVIAASGTDVTTFLNTVGDYFASYYTRNESFTVEASSMASLVETMTSMLSTVSMAISAVAAIALLVGGIGVMNIMTVSVTERTREIGTRKALGAPGSAIRMQFIVEAMTLCLIGGIIGVAFGVGLGSIAAAVMGYAASPSLSVILLAVGFSMAIGVFFGYYPANKAAKMNPIDALRYE